MNEVMMIPDRAFMALLALAVALVVLGLWGAITHALHELRATSREVKGHTKVLIKRTELLEAHVRIENPELFEEKKEEA